MVSGLSKLGQMIQPQNGGFSVELANFLLSLKFSEQEQIRYQELAAKCQDGALSEAEQAEIDEFLAANTLLMILQSKARVSLKNSPSAA